MDALKLQDQHVVIDDIALMLPEYLPESAWLQHIPFAFWIVKHLAPKTLVELGTHRGASYFAFCQAIERLGLGTTCYAVDSWKGDKHTGPYGDDIWKDVNAHNTRRYQGFSTLIRKRFNETLPFFSDGSIDLLHIDGFHTYEAVREDFDSWFPKLSKDAVVLFHDTNVRRDAFGVHRLMDELRGEYPLFEFHHGYGLGVLCRGTPKTSELAAVFSQEEATLIRLRKNFAYLGGACESLYRAGNFEEKYRAVLSIIAQRDREIKLKTDILHSKATEKAILDKKISQLEHDIQNIPQQKTKENEDAAQAYNVLTEMLVKIEKILTQNNSQAKHATQEMAQFVQKTKNRLDETSSALRQVVSRVDIADAYRKFTLIRMADGKLKKRIASEIKQMKTLKGVDLDWYLRVYPDVAKAGVDPVTHYVSTGVYEGRNPAPNFSTTAYLLRYPDVIKAGINPFLHYLLSGQLENRVAQPAENASV